jgi:hypothetical protein
MKNSSDLLFEIARGVTEAYAAGARAAADNRRNERCAWCDWTEAMSAGAASLCDSGQQLVAALERAGLHEEFKDEIDYAKRARAAFRKAAEDAHE